MLSKPQSKCGSVMLKVDLCWVHQNWMHRADNEIQGYNQLCIDPVDNQIQGYNHVISNQLNRPKANQLEPVRMQSSQCKLVAGCIMICSVDNSAGACKATAD